MKTIKILLISLLVGSSLASCEFLEKEPTYSTAENTLKNEADVVSFLTGVYSALQESSFYGNEYLFLIGGDDLGHYGGDKRPANSYGLICNNANTSDPSVAKLWFTLYAGINRANYLLERIDAVPEMNEANRKQYKSEARFLRAFYYFNLVQCWGDVPFKTNSTEDAYNLSIPRTDKQTIYDFIIKEMYGCAEDLKSAADLNYQPGRISKSITWGMLARVYMFRAGEPNRDKIVGLTNNTTEAEIQEYFKKASYYGQLVMNEGHSLAANYWDFFIDICSDKYNTALNKEGAKANESIWEIEFAGNRSTDVRAEGRIGNIIGIQAPDLSAQSSVVGKNDPGYSYAFIWTTPKLLAMYEANGDSKRYNWNIAPFTYSRSKTGGPVDGRLFVKGKMNEVKSQYGDKSYSYSPIYDSADPTKVIGGDRESTSAPASNRNRDCGKYRREYEPDKKSKNDTSINFPILRYADILLMIAEAENEVNHGPNNLAYACINAVRERAGISKLQGLDETGFRNKIKDERAMELCFEYTRRFDLIRWGDYVKNMNDLVDIAKTDESWKYGVNVYNYFNISKAYNYFPIPSTEIASNSAIKTNNPGW